ncbi:MAG: formate/nitrite transporter family protein [Coprococcus sp.]|nr:formate/nitrite transporter family protein [Coprococcus sp.]
MFAPAEIAKNYVAVGKAKVKMSVGRMFLLAVLAGAFIGLGGAAAATASGAIPQASVGKLVGAVIFPGGLTMVLLAGSELFTGNSLLVIPLLMKEITPAEMLKNWGVVYTGNMAGGFLAAAGVVFSHQISLFDGQLAVSVLSTAAAKCTISFGDALIRGILCNFLVCIAVWISFAAKDVTGKIAGIFFPIMIFVLCGFEHSVANMYYIAAGLFAKGVPVYARAAEAAGVDLGAITWGNFLGANLLPVTIGNVIGGAVCVGCAYWFVYLRSARRQEK